MNKGALAEIWFPLGIMLFSILGVLLGIKRYQAFMENTRSRHAQQMSFAMAQRAAKTLRGFVEVIITAVVPHDTTVLIGYHRTSPPEPNSQNQPTDSDSPIPTMSGTMVAWFNASQVHQLEQLSQWCHMKSPVLLRLDTELKLIGFYSLEQDHSVELALLPSSD